MLAAATAGVGGGGVFGGGVGGGVVAGGGGGGDAVVVSRRGREPAQGLAVAGRAGCYARRARAVGRSRAVFDLRIGRLVGGPGDRRGGAGERTAGHGADQRRRRVRRAA